MQPLTLIETIQTVIHMIFGSPFFMVLLLFLIAFSIFSFFSKKILKNATKKFYICLYSAIVLLLLVRYSSASLKLVDYVLEQIVTMFYFPNLIMIIMMIGVGTTLFLRTVLSDKDGNKKKILHIMFYSLLMFFVLSCLKEVVTEGIDVYSASNIYKNETCLSMLQLATISFGLWMGIYGTNCVYHKLVMVSNLEKVEQVRHMVPSIHQLVALDSSMEAKFSDYIPSCNTPFEPVFETPIISSFTNNMIEERKTIDVDTLVKESSNEQELMKRVKELISNDQDKLTLYDYQALRKVLAGRS